MRPRVPNSRKDAVRIHQCYPQTGTFAGHGHCRVQREHGCRAGAPSVAGVVGSVCDSAAINHKHLARPGDCLAVHDGAMSVLARGAHRHDPRQDALVYARPHV